MKNASLYALILCAGIITLSSFLYYPKWKQPFTEATIGWDVAGYYLYLPAIFIYGDVKKLNFADSLNAQYRFSPGVDAFWHSSGNRVMKYSCGQALQFLPWFVLGHIAALGFGFPADGYSLPYQVALSWGSLLVAILGLLFLRKILLRYFSDETTALTLLLLVLGTNYLEYSALQGALTHNWLFTVYALILYSTIQFYEKPGWRYAGIIGILTGWAALTRPTDIIIALIPLFWGISSIEKYKERLDVWRLHSGKLVLAGLITIAIGSIQLFYWKYTTGKWLLYTYEEQGFSWLRPHILNGLFSYRAGWLLYTPVMAFAILGFIPLAKRQKVLFPGILIFCCLYLYITFAWDIWWYGGSLSQRALIQSYPIWAFPLAAFIQWVRVKPRALQAPALALSVFFVYLNLWWTHQAHRGGFFKSGEMTKAYFWKVVGRINLNEEAVKLLDLNDEMTSYRNSVEVLYQNNFESDSLLCPLPAISGNNSFFLDASHPQSPIYPVRMPNPSAQWIRVSAGFYCPQKEWDSNKMVKMGIRYFDYNTLVEECALRVYNFLNYDGQTRTIFLDSKIPRKAFNRAEVFFWNAQSDKILLIDDLIVEAYTAVPE